MLSTAGDPAQRSKAAGVEFIEESGGGPGVRLRISKESTR
jgi:hypothetical protein